MANDPPFQYMHDRLQASADAQELTVSCLLCPKWEGVTGPAETARAAAEAHRVELHPDLVGKKRIVRRRRSFSASMTAERETQIEEERRQRMRALGIA